MSNQANLPAVIQKAVTNQKIDPDSVNLMLPTQTFGEVLGQYDKITIEVVRIDPDPKAGDVYEPSYNKFALGKRPLQAISNAVGIIWDPTETTILESSERKSRGKATAAMRKPNGEWIVLSEEKTVDLDAVEEEQRMKFEDEAEKGFPYWEGGRKHHKAWTSEADKVRWIDKEVKKAVLQYRKFKDERAMTGAKERVIRACLAIKNTYTKDELARPFAFPRVTMNADKLLEDPRMRREAMDAMRGSVRTLFGPRNGHKAIDVTPEKEALPEPTEGIPEQPEANGGPSEGEEKPIEGPSFDDIPWGDDEPEEKPKSSEIEQLREWFQDRLKDKLSRKTKDWILNFLDKDPGSQDLEVLKRYKSSLEKLMAKAGGAS